MKSIKATEIREKSVPELEELIKQERAALYKARRDLVFRQVRDTSTIMVRRHNIARMMTLIQEKKRGSN